MTQFRYILSFFFILHLFCILFITKRVSQISRNCRILQKPHEQYKRRVTTETFLKYLYPSPPPTHTVLFLPFPLSYIGTFSAALKPEALLSIYIPILHCLKFCLNIAEKSSLDRETSSKTTEIRIYRMVTTPRK